MDEMLVDYIQELEMWLKDLGSPLPAMREDIEHLLK